MTALITSDCLDEHHSPRCKHGLHPTVWPCSLRVACTAAPHCLSLLLRGPRCKHGLSSNSAALFTSDCGQAANGGGVVYFPTGQYFIHGPLVVAPGVVLRGASRELVSIYFHEDNQHTASKDPRSAMSRGSLCCFPSRSLPTDGRSLVTHRPPAYITSSRPGACSRRRDHCSAAPPSPCTSHFNRDGEGASAK